MARPLCIVWAAAAAWVASGAVGFTSAAGTRIGVLPTSAATIVLVLAAAIAVALLLRAGTPRAPLTLLVLTFLPWLPFRVPAAFLMWSGPLAAAVWVAVLLMLASGIRWRRDSRAPGAVPTGDRRLAPLTAGVLAFALFGVAAWRAAPIVPTGDEPHYLVITQSLLRDGDLQIENNHRRGDYRAFYDGELLAHVQRPGRNGQIYSIHAPGLPALVLPAFALAGYPGVVLFLLVVSATGSALAWWVGWLAARRTDAAWFAWAAVTLPVTAVFHSFSVYPDGPGGMLTLTGGWALLRAEDERNTGAQRSAPWFWHGAALAMLPWLHSRFAVIAGCLGAVVLLRLSTTRGAAAKAVAFLAIPAVSAALWVAYFIAIYGSPDPSAPYDPGQMGSLAWIPGGLAGLLFDQRFGLLPYAPVVAFALAGLAVMIAMRESRRMAFELLFVIVPYLLTVTHFAMWWGGSSAPARFFVPVLPLLAIPAARFWVSAAHRHWRTAVLAALVFTGLATAVLVLVERGRLVFNARDTPALWLVWLSAVSDLPQALPWWTRGGEGAFARDIAIWMAAVIAAVLVARALSETPALRGRAPRGVALAWLLAAAVMGASTIVWASRGVDGRTVASAQLELLRDVAAEPRSLALDIERARRIRARDVPRSMRITFTRALADPRGAARDARPLFDVPPLPAGEYRLTPGAAARGWLMVGIGRDQFSIHSAPMTSPPQPVDVRLPVVVRGLLVRGDEEARQSVSELTIEPLHLLSGDAWKSHVARRAVRYAGATVFFLDNRSYTEPEAFWAGGGGRSAFVVQPDDRRRPIGLLLRNGPVANAVVVEIAGNRQALAFAPREERRLELAVDGVRGAALIALDVSSGFRPSEHDPSSRDGRFLGIWMKVE